MRHNVLLALVLCCVTILAALPASAQETRTITDAAGRSVEIPVNVERVICSGPGCLRLLTYLQAQDMIVAVDDIEARRSQFDARPYALANPWFKDLPIFGEFRGFDNPELILCLDPQPQVIFKTYATMGHDPQELQDKTGIPVVVLEYGNLARSFDKVAQCLRLMGGVVDREERAEEVVGYMQSLIDDLKARSQDIPESERIATFIGGVAHKGPHGFQSTEPTYPPFAFVGAENLGAEGLAGNTETSDVAKEMILAWDPEVLFLDLSTLQLGEGADGLHELRTDPAYQALTAVQSGKVYGVLPYNWYTANYGSILANAYFVGAVLYPERFGDVDPAARADEIYTLLVGEPVFETMNGFFGNMAFEAVNVN
ncbi:MAG: iron ABC transporter substrate-binding protein [Desulfovibrio sp.]|nr:MAG: iron ABC transporter substrate-binding protein [Desulfovibrio sp.]